MKGIGRWFHQSLAMRSCSTLGQHRSIAGLAELSYEVYGDRHGDTMTRRTSQTAKQTDTIAVFHGMLGNHKNLRKVGHQLSDQTGYQSLLVTHRAHGESEQGQPPHTIQACAADALQLFNKLSLSNEHVPKVLIGHSFGGKVIVELLRAMEEESTRQGTKLHLPHHVILLDSIPFPKKMEAIDPAKKFSDSVFAIIESLKTVQQPLESKNALVEVLMKELNFPSMLAYWMTTNLSKTPRKTIQADTTTEKGYFLSFDLDICSKLMKEFQETDVSPIMLNSLFRNVQFTLVQAERNDHWKDEDISNRIKMEFKGKDNIEVVLLKDAGHWVHVDQLDNLVKLMVDRLR